MWNGVMMIQFHQSLITEIDQGLDIHCFYEAKIPNKIGESRIKDPSETVCSYTLRKFGRDECVGMDFFVGDTVFHRWECNHRKLFEISLFHFHGLKNVPLICLAPNYSFLVHSCTANWDSGSVAILDDNG